MLYYYTNFTLLYRISDTTSLSTLLYYNVNVTLTCYLFYITLVLYLSIDTNQKLVPIT